MVDIAKLRIVVDADTTPATRGFAAATLATQGWASATTGAFNSVGGAGRALEGVWSSLSTGQKTLAGFGIGAALAGTALKAVVGPAIEFESAFAGVRKTVDATPAGLERIRSSLLDMSRVMPTSAAELAGIAESAGALGVAAPNIANFTRVVAQLGETTDLGFEDAATQLARFMNLTQAAPGDVERLSNSLVALGNNGASTEAEILNISLRLASAFTLAGAAAPEILAVGEAMTSLGERAEEGGSALSVAITKISDASKLGGNELRTFAETAGLLPEEFAAIAKENPVEALLLFSEGLAQVEARGDSITPILDTLGLAGIRTSDAFRKLALESDYVRQQIALSNDEFQNGSALSDEYGKRAETTAARLEILRNRLTALAIAAGTPTLGLFAQGADLAGDAIEAVARALSVLGPALGDVLGNGAGLASSFWAALGSPTAQVALGTLQATAAAVAALLTILDSLGPAGLLFVALAADVALVGPASLALVAAWGALTSIAVPVSASLATVGVSATASALAIDVAAAAASVGPWIALAAVVAAVGKGFYDAGRLADESAASFSKGVDDALASGSFRELESQLAAVRDRQQELADSSTSTEFWGRLGLAVQSTVQQVTPFNNSIQQAQTELAALDKLAAENGWSTYEASLEGTASVLGLTVEETFRLAQEMGLLNAIVAGSGEDMQGARDAMKEVVGAADELTGSVALTREELIAGAQDLGSLATALGVSQTNLEKVAQTIEGFSFADLFDDDPNVRLAALAEIVAVVETKYAALADQAGLTTDEFLDQVFALSDLAAAHGDLQAAINGTRDALALVNAQQDAAVASTDAFTAALDGLDGSFASAQEAAGLGRQAILDFAGTAPSMNELQAKMADVATSFYEAATASGVSREEALLLTAEYLRIPLSVLTQILADATQAKAEAEEVRGLLHDFTVAEWRALIQADPTLALDAILSGQLAASAFTDAEWVALIEADPRLALLGIADAEIAAEAYVNGGYVAPLEADWTQAEGILNRAVGAARAFASADYTAILRGNDAPAAGIIGRVQAQANAFRATYEAVLTARDATGGIIGRALATARSFAGTFNATLTTTQQTVIRPTRTINAEGGIYGAGGVQFFAGGGVSGFSRLIRETPGQAKFYGPAGDTARIFDEPVTGGEWYIPRRGDAGRQFQIWMHAGRTLGFFGSAFGTASGLPATGSDRAPAGSAGGAVVTIHAPVSVVVEGSQGLSEAEVGRIVGQEVSASLSQLGQRLANARR